MILICSTVGVTGVTVTLHIGFVSSEGWQTLVKGWGDANVWVHAPWELGLIPLTNALSKCLFV